MISCCIFDLDGVIVDTARYHYLAWRELAAELGFEFREDQAEAIKGVSRMASLDIVLRAGGMEGRFSDEVKMAFAMRKNERYREFIAKMTPAEVLPGVEDFLKDLRDHKIGIVLGSASKNTRAILEQCRIGRWLDAVVDGTMIQHGKPDPEVFLKGAEMAKRDPAECVVFEDAVAGIEAARRGGMRSVGVGKSEALAAASMRIESFEGFTFDELRQKLD